MRLRHHLFAILSCLLIASPCAAEDLADSVIRLQQQISSLQKQIWSSQRRLLASTSMDPRSDLTFSQLDSIDHVLDGTSNGLDLLSQSLLLAGMVTEPRYKQMAQRVIALNEAALANRASRGVESTEKLLPRSKDLETSRLTLETRDVLREIAALLTNRSANNAR